MTAGEIVRQFRRQKKLSQLELAKRLGLTQTALSHYEIGTRKISVDLALKIIAVLDITIMDFFSKMESEEEQAATSATRAADSKTSK